MLSLVPEVRYHVPTGLSRFTYPPVILNFSNLGDKIGGACRHISTYLGMERSFDVFLGTVVINIVAAGDVSE